MHLQSKILQDSFMRMMTLYNILSLCHIKYGKNVKEYLLCYLKLILHKARFKGLGKYTVY